jgi:hypothetical protein
VLHERRNFRVHRFGDCCFAFERAESHWVSDADFESSRAEPPSTLFLQLTQSQDRDRENRRMSLSDQQTDSRSERRKPTYNGSRAFRKYEHVVPAVHGLTGVREASLEVPSARQGEDVV